MRYNVFVEVKTIANNWEIRQKVIKALNRDDAYHQVEKYFEKLMGEEWKKRVKIKKVQPLVYE